MDRGKILVTLPFPPEWVPRLAGCMEMAEREGYQAVLAPGGDLKEEQLRPLLPGVKACVCSGDFWTREILREAVELRVLSRMGVGYDRIDLQAATEMGVLVTTTPGANAPDVAEYAFAMMLAAARRIGEADRAVRGGEWPKVFGHSLYGKTLGVAGFGNIGRRLAKLVQGFDMRVLAFDGHRDAEYAEKNGIQYVEWNALIEQSDVLSIHMPLTPETKGMIGEAEFSRMKRGVILVNCARGGIVEEGALARAIQEGVVYAAALDVFEDEPLPASSPLRGLENVLLSPHTAGLTFEGRGLLIEQAFANALDALAGKAPRGTINPEALKKQEGRRG